MGKRHALTQLAALAALGTAGAVCVGVTHAIISSEYDIQQEFYPDAVLIFDDTVDGVAVREYTQPAWEGSEEVDTFLEETRSDGSEAVYADVYGSDGEMDWVAFSSDGVTRLYNGDSVWVFYKMLGITQDTKIPYDHEGAGQTMMEWATARYDELLEGIVQERLGEGEAAQEAIWIPELGKWHSPAPQEQEAQPQAEQPFPPWIDERYIAGAEVVFDETLPEGRMRLYEWYRYGDREAGIEHIVITVDRSDGTRILYQDWQGSRSLNAVAITESGVTRFYENNVLRVFEGDEQTEYRISGIGEPVFEEAQQPFEEYFDSIYRQIGTVQERVEANRNARNAPIYPVRDADLELLRGER